MAAVRVRDFVTALFDGVDGHVDIRTLRPVEQAFVCVGDWEGLEAFVKPRRNRDCYLGVAARVTSGDGSLANCGALPALFADLDLKTIGETEARRQLHSMALPPSITVQSGGGYHAYWLLREPLGLQRESGVAKALLRRLAHHLSADLAAAEPARILRVPNTRNFKYQPPRLVSIEGFDPDRRYNASELDDWLPPEPTYASGVSEATADVIPEGRRNARLTSLAGSMRRSGMSEDAMLAALRIENTRRCHPPLPEAEVEAIARSVARYETKAAHHAPSRPLELTTLSDLLAEPDHAVDWLISERLPIGGVAMLVGKPKSGKSTAARDLALQVARGGSWLGFACLKRPVIYVALEDRREDVRRHFRAMGATNEPLRFVFRESLGDLVKELQSVAAADRPGLIIVDTLQRAIKARDLNDYAEVTTKLTPILALARETGAAVLLIHHAGKAVREDALDSVLGSTALSGSVDNIFLLRRNDRYRTLQSIQRVGPDLPETVLELDPTGATRNGGTRREADEQHVQTACVEALASGSLARPALLEGIEARRTDKLRALKELIEKGTVVRSGTGKRSDPYIYAIAAAVNGGSRVPVPSGEPSTQTAPSAELPSDSAKIDGSLHVVLPWPISNRDVGDDAVPHELFPRPAVPDGPLPPLSKTPDTPADEEDR